MQVMPNHAESAVPPAVQTHARPLEEGCRSLTLTGISHPLLQVLDGFLVIFLPLLLLRALLSLFPRVL